MKYLLVQNRQQGNPVVLLGPIEWRQRFIQSELNDLEIDYRVPPVEQGYIAIASTLEIIPIVESEDPNLDEVHEQPAGPFYTYEGNVAKMYYTKSNKPIEQVKGYYKNRAANKRYEKENAGTMVSINGTEVWLSTSRDSRPQYYQLLNTIGEGTVNWKFNTGFIEINLQNVQDMVNALTTHVQAQFDWEKSKLDEIDACTTIEQLKSLDLN